jgi:hypothetical protein
VVSGPGTWREVASLRGFGELPVSDSACFPEQVPDRLRPLVATKERPTLEYGAGGVRAPWRRGVQFTAGPSLEGSGMRTCVRGWGWLPYAAFRRAIEARNLTRAITEARDLPKISLADAAELVVMAAEQHGPSFDRWAGRWAARYALEEANVTLDEAHLVLAALAGLRQADRQAAAIPHGYWVSGDGAYRDRTGDLRLAKP